jgi:hypothetical protein
MGYDASNYFAEGLAAGSAWSACIPNDPICEYDGKWKDLLPRMYIHTSYTTKLFGGETIATEGGKFLASQVS